MAERTKIRSCRVCGCTDDRSCYGGCWWVAEDLCSACEDRVTISLPGLEADTSIEPSGRSVIARFEAKGIRFTVLLSKAQARKLGKRLVAAAGLRPIERR